MELYELPTNRNTTICPADIQEKGKSMQREELLKRISIDPKVCFGKPCIRCTRIWVSLILDFLAGGMTIEQLLKEYPALERADILSCIAYGAEMTRYIDIPSETVF